MVLHRPVHFWCDLVKSNGEGVLRQRICTPRVGLETPSKGSAWALFRLQQLKAHGDSAFGSSQQYAQRALLEL